MNIRFAAAAVAAITALSLTACGTTTVVSSDEAGTVNEQEVSMMTTVFSQYDPEEQRLMCAFWENDPAEAYQSFSRYNDTTTQTTFNAAMIRNCS